MLTVRSSSSLVAALASAFVFSSLAFATPATPVAPATPKAPADGTPAKQRPAKTPKEGKDGKDGSTKSTAKLKVGDKAPELKVAKFVKGSEVKSFEAGKVYVVECWATWCGPCIQNIPHLTELQTKFKDKVTIIGVSVWENDVSKVEPFVKEKGEKMGYTVAMDDLKSAPKGYVAENWLKAADRNGIPSAFIVDGEGKLAFIGHPAEPGFEATLKKLTSDSKAKPEGDKKDSAKDGEKKDAPKDGSKDGTKEPAKETPKAPK